MKKVIILFTVLMTSMLAFAQQKEQARFHVTYAIYNGEDITEWAIKSKLFTVFYTVNEELYMANYSETNETQSWGVIWELKNESIPETASKKCIYNRLLLNILYVINQKYGLNL